MEIKVHDEGAEWDVVLLDNTESLSWVFPNQNAAENFAGDLAEVLRAHHHN
tara:strand:+ start:293 stop:445 length:153 start_codon:yes stop_codon:yes gene_type:complete